MDKQTQNQSTPEVFQWQCVCGQPIGSLSKKQFDNNVIVHQLNCRQYQEAKRATETASP